MRKKGEGDVSRQKKEEGKEKKNSFILLPTRFSDPVMCCLERTHGFLQRMFYLLNCSGE